MNYLDTIERQIQWCQAFNLKLKNDLKEIGENISRVDMRLQRLQLQEMEISTMIDKLLSEEKK